MPPIKRFSPGQFWADSRAQLNALIDVANAVLGMAGDELVTVNHGSVAGLSLAINRGALAQALARDDTRKAWYKIVSNDSGGAYTVRRLYWDAAAGELADVDSDNNEYSVDATERSADDTLAADDIVPGWWLYSGEGENLVIEAPAAEGTADTPANASADDATSQTASSKTWDRNSPTSGTDGVSLRVQTRTVYNASGDAVLYAYYVTMTYDSKGCLLSISGETRVAVDTPGPCTT